jgi:hypothetical protein
MSTCFFMGDLEGYKVRDELSRGHSEFRPNFDAIVSQSISHTEGGQPE